MQIDDNWEANKFEIKFLPRLYLLTLGSDLNAGTIERQRVLAERQREIEGDSFELAQSDSCTILSITVDLTQWQLGMIHHPDEMLTRERLERAIVNLEPSLNAIANMEKLADTPGRKRYAKGYLISLVGWYWQMGAKHMTDWKVLDFDMTTEM